MPALNFKKRFADMVAAGEKTQTIRARRKDGRDPRPGDRLYLYTGLRTKSCRRLRVAVATRVRDVYIADGVASIDGRALDDDALRALAVADGFETVADFIDFFRTIHGLPFRGKLISWG